MKQNIASLALCLLATGIWSCSDNNTHGSEYADSTSTTTTTIDSSNASMNSNTTPIVGEDSAFVMEAAMGGMMEVQGGTVAQQKAMNQRVKDFGSMMVTDHSQANNELKSLVSSRGIMLPDSLGNKMQKDLAELSKLDGKKFDSKYVSEMVEDHKKDVQLFQQKAQTINDPDLKNWVNKTLPVLQKHLDSIQAIAKDIK
jgi:putative membrane protein